MPDQLIAGWTVLIIEDELDNVNVVRKVMEFHGANVYAAHNGIDGLKMLTNMTPSLILLDLSMPQMDGWEVLSTLRGKIGLAQLPVIALTAHAMSGDEESVMRAGFDGYIAKPIRISTLLSKIKDALERTGKLQHAQTNAASQPRRPTKLDVQDVRVLIVEDEFDSIRMVSKILNYHKVETRIVHNGFECLSALAEYTPSVIVMDLAMPGKNGWETLYEIRANAVTQHIPVVAVTAYGSSNVAQDALEAGFNAYFPKPLSPATFVRDILRVVKE
jgi:CheY-like chemotaxis protein